MYQSDLRPDTIIDALVTISATEPVAILDSCGVSHLDSHLLIAGINPVESISLNSNRPESDLLEFDRILEQPETASIFTISYEFGLKILGLGPGLPSSEPDIFIHVFENLIVHDYATGQTSIEGNPGNEAAIFSRLRDASKATTLNKSSLQETAVTDASNNKFSSNFSKSEYLERIKTIHSHIRRGNTYQTNLTQQFDIQTSELQTPQSIFTRLRKTHPAAFSAFLKRADDYVVSISPERFLSIAPDVNGKDRIITSSPIKGTRKRGADPDADEALRQDLLSSVKDRAENTMIVDLIRNDLGKVCKYGSVLVETLCAVETHPTLFHLVSTVRGVLRADATPSEVLLSVFPCGSITGCPKIRTMELIRELETRPRGLGMGAIGYSGFDKGIDLNVAIRTLVFKGGKATLNVGGGIVIDSDPEEEYRESLLKAKAIFEAFDSSIV